MVHEVVPMVSRLQPLASKSQYSIVRLAGVSEVGNGCGIRVHIGRA